MMGLKVTRAQSAQIRLIDWEIDVFFKSSKESAADLEPKLKKMLKSMSTAFHAKVSPSVTPR